MGAMDYAEVSIYFYVFTNRDIIELNNVLLESIPFFVDCHT